MCSCPSRKHAGPSPRPVTPWPQRSNPQPRCAAALGHHVRFARVHSAMAALDGKPTSWLTLDTR